MEEKTMLCVIVLSMTLMLRRILVERINNDGRAESTEQFLDTMFGKKRKDDAK